VGAADKGALSLARFQIAMNRPIARVPSELRTHTVGSPSATNLCVVNYPEKN